MSEEEIKIPVKQWYHLGDYLTRQDEIQANMLEALKRILRVLEAIVPPVIPPVLGSVEIGSINPAVLEYLSKNPLPVVAYPTGEIRRKGVLSTLTTSYVTLVKYKPTKDMTFHLCKIVVSCSEDVIAQLFWGTEEITIPYYMFEDFPLVEFFPPLCRRYDGKEIIGDGTTELLLRVKMPTGGTSAEVNGEIAGDER